MPNKKVLCIGNAVLDQIFSVNSIPHTAGKHFATAFLEAGGGPAATGAVAAARLGGQVTLWSRIGDDSAGNTIASELEKYGVSLRGLKRLTGVVSSIAAVFVNPEGERMIVNYIDPRLPQNVPDWLPLDEVKNFDCVLADVRWPAAAAAVLEAAKAGGVPTVLDADLSPNTEALNTLAPLAAHVIFSEGGLKQYTGEASPKAGLQKAAEQCSGTPYVTMGEKGCLWLEKETGEHFFPSFKVNVVDTTGAGDVFHGAFALALAEGLPRTQVVRFAAAAAALKCTRPGGRAGIPDRAVLENFLQNNQ